MEYQPTNGRGLVYQERIALPSMPPHRVEQIVMVARARQVKLMQRTADAIEFGDANF